MPYAVSTNAAFAMEHPQTAPNERLQQAAAQRILILDGAMGTMIQRLGLDEAAFRGPEFAAHFRELKGCNDLLSITRADAIVAIHHAYLDAGADILSTNTFNANRISLSDYGLSDHVRQINLAAVQCARRAVEEYRVALGGTAALGCVQPSRGTAALGCAAAGQPGAAAPRAPAQPGGGPMRPEGG